MDAIGRVRRAYLVQGRNINALARELRLAPNTVRDIVRASGGRESPSLVISAVSRRPNARDVAFENNQRACGGEIIRWNDEVVDAGLEISV